MSAHATRPLWGIALVVAASACFAAMDTTNKFLSGAVPVVMVMWFRYCFQAIATAAFVMPRRGWSVWHTRHLPFQVLRGLLLLGASLMAFTSLRYLPVGEFTAIVMIAPLVVTLLAATVLKERVSLLRWTLVAGGFAGTVVIIRPGGAAFTLATLLPLCVVVCNACFQLLTTRLARTEDPITMHLYTGWVGAAVTSVLLPLFWSPHLQAAQWAALAFIGAMATVGHFILILAFLHAGASTLTPFMYSQIFFAMVGGWLVFGHVPDAPSVFGMALIAACGAASAWLTVRERRLADD